VLAKKKQPNITQM